MKNSKASVVIIFALFLSLFSWAQSATSNQVSGKWKMCDERSLSKTFQCDQGYTFEFFDNGTYKEDRQPIVNGKQMPYVTGKWTLDKNMFTMDEDDFGMIKSSPAEYKIVWIDNDRFYSVGREGRRGPKIYTCFWRIR